MVPCHRRIPPYCLIIVALVIGFTLSAATHSAQCIWLYYATEGERTNYVLEQRWEKGSCPDGKIRYVVKDAHGNEAKFTDSHYPVLEFAAPNQGMAQGVNRSSHVDVGITCEGRTPVCSAARVYFVVGPAAESPTPAPPTVPPEPPEPPTSSSSAGTPQPGPECHPTVPVRARIGTPTVLYPLTSVENCAEPHLSVLSATDPTGASSELFSTSKADGEPVVVFDAKGGNMVEGNFTVVIHVHCAPGSPSECYITQWVQVYREAPAVPPCKNHHGYRVSFSEQYRGLIEADAAGGESCPPETPHFTFVANTSPESHPEEFSLDVASGTFFYHAPSGPSASHDSFQFILGCSASETPTASSAVPLCIGIVDLYLTAAPAPPTDAPVVPILDCPGSFEYLLSLNDDHTFTPRAATLVGPLITTAEFCPGGKIKQSALTQKPTHGSIDQFNSSTGEFYYTPSRGVPAAKMDSFGFTLTCDDDDKKTCRGNATISITARTQVDDGSVFRLRQDSIICRGTCDAGAWKSTDSHVDGYFDSTHSPLGDNRHVTPRKDKRPVDGMSFDFTADGDLLLRAFTTIGNMAARFVTFTPLTPESVGKQFTSTSLADKWQASFDASCLDKQVTHGSARDIWSWTDESTLQGHLNVDTNNYKDGDNYFHKFGGNHRSCDVYRIDPCKYAPLLTPSISAGGEGEETGQANPIQWKLYINDCDATWVGRASVTMLRSLRQPDGTPVFQPVAGTSQLKGTVYSQVIKPRSWTSPDEGIVTTVHAYELLLSIHNSIIIATQASPVAKHASDPAPHEVWAEVSSARDKKESLDHSKTLPSLHMDADIEFAVTEDRKTTERVYVYHVALYPYRLLQTSQSASPVIEAVDARELQLPQVTLVNASWTFPTLADCPECSGRATTCIGTGLLFSSDCGFMALLKFEELTRNIEELDPAESDSEPSAMLPSTSLAGRTYYNISFSARLSGKGSANSVREAPSGAFHFMIKLVTGEKFLVSVHQKDNVGGISIPSKGSRMCRPSPYWPVPDTLGTSLSITPFDPKGAADTAELAVTERYGPPVHISAPEICAAPVGDIMPLTEIHNLTATVPRHGANVTAFMCAESEARVFGITDWVYITLPAVGREIVSHEPDSDVVVAGELQHLVLSVAADETVLGQHSVKGDTDISSNSMLHILLDGRTPTISNRSEEAMWMHPGDLGTSLMHLYPWSKYASSVNYRRVTYTFNDSSKHMREEPFNFALIPGAMLHSRSSARVQFCLEGLMKFTKFRAQSVNGGHGDEQVALDVHEEKMRYCVFVSRSIASISTFSEQAYTPEPEAAPSSGLSEGGATALLVFLIAALVIAVAVGAKMELNYSRSIQNAKYAVDYPDVEVDIAANMSGGLTTPREAMASAVHNGAGSSTVAVHVGGKQLREEGIHTKYGVVEVEMPRCEERGIEHDTQVSVSVADYQVRPPVCVEQMRVSDNDEVADF